VVPDATSRITGSVLHPPGLPGSPVAPVAPVAATTPAPGAVSVEVSSGEEDLTAPAAALPVPVPILGKRKYNVSLNPDNDCVYQLEYFKSDWDFLNVCL